MDYVPTNQKGYIPQLSVISSYRHMQPSGPPASLSSLYHNNGRLADRGTDGIYHIYMSYLLMISCVCGSWIYLHPLPSKGIGWVRSFQN